MAVMVEEVQTAKTGRSLRVKLGGTWYGAALDSGLNGAKGQMVEAEIVTEKYGPWVKAWKPSAIAGVNAPPAVPAQPAVQNPRIDTTRTPEPQYAEPSKNVAPWYMPFVSNVVAHAIQAGKIQDPSQIRSWLIAAKAAATTHDDGIPF